MEFCPEENGKLFVHDALGALLLRSLDLLQLQISAKKEEFTSSDSAVCDQELML